MPDATGNIIPFPSRSAPPDGQTRLEAALIALDGAVAAQRAAVADWQAQLRNLREANAALGTTMTGFHDRLGQVGVRIDGINAEARRLEAWADGIIAQHER